MYCSKKNRKRSKTEEDCRFFLRCDGECTMRAAAIFAFFVIGGFTLPAADRPPSGVSLSGRQRHNRGGPPASRCGQRGSHRPGMRLPGRRKVDCLHHRLVRCAGRSLLHSRPRKRPTGPRSGRSHLFSPRRDSRQGAGPGASPFRGQAEGRGWPVPAGVERPNGRGSP